MIHLPRAAGIITRIGIPGVDWRVVSAAKKCLYRKTSVDVAPVEWTLAV